MPRVDGTLYAGFRLSSPFMFATVDPLTGEVFGIESDLLGGNGGAENLAFTPEGELLATAIGIIYRVDFSTDPVTSVATGIEFGTDVDAFEIMDDGAVFFINESIPTSGQSTLFRRDSVDAGSSETVQVYDLEIFGMTAVGDHLFVADEIVAIAPLSVPTVGDVGLIVLAALLGGLAVFRISTRASGP